MMDNDVTFGPWLRRRRRGLDLTQRELAQRVGCGVTTIRKIEAGERRPSKDLAAQLATCLEIAPGEYDSLIAFARLDRPPPPAPEVHPFDSSPILSDVTPLPPFLAEDIPPIDLPVFVAREQELAQLETHLTASLTGQGRVVFITGEAGQGKTALMAEFARRAQAVRPDLIVAGGNCNAYTGTGDPYLPFRDVFSLLTGDLEARWAAGALSAGQARRLWWLLPETIQALTEHGPDLLDVLVPVAALAKRIATYAPARVDLLNQLQRFVEASRPVNLDQRQLFEQVTLALRALGVAQPLLLLLDDLQWADSASLNLLFHLGRRLSGNRILILGAYRVSEVAVGDSEDRSLHLLEAVVNEFKRHFGDIQLDLEQFEPAEERAFVDALLDREPNRLGPAFRETLFWHTKGHPLFTIELLRDMQERGNLMRDEAGYWVEGMPLDWNTLPVRVEAVIKQRIDRLDSSLQEILTIASIEGELFTAQVVAQAQPQDEPQVLRQLAQELGRRHRLVREYEEIKVGSQYLTRFQFGHVLFQQYLYQRLSQAERRLWHDQIARILEAIYTGHLSEIIIQLAYHYTQAGNPEKAVKYLLQAGDQARRVVALDEAIRFYRAALEQWPEEEQAGQAETLLKLGECLLVTGEYQDAMAAYEAGQVLFEQLGDRMQTGAMQRLIARLYWEQGDRGRAERHYHQALAILEQGPESVELARAISGISQMHMLASAYDQAIAWGTRALALAQRLAAEDVIIHALNNIGSAYLKVHDRERGLALLQDSLHRALTLGLPHDACRAYVNMGDSLGWICRYDEAKTTFEELLAYATRVHASVFVGVALEALVKLDWQGGKWAAALVRRQNLLAWIESLLSTPVARVWASTLLGRIYNDLGQPQAARQLLEDELLQARGAAEVQTTVPHLAQLARALANLGLETGTTALVQEFLALIDRTPDAHLGNTLALLFACQWFTTHPVSRDLLAARASLGRLGHTHMQIGNLETEAAYHEGQGIIALAEANPTQAVEAFRHAANRWQALNRPYDQLRALCSLARALEQVGDLQQAQIALDQALQRVEMLAAQLQDSKLKTSFLNSPLVQKIQPALSLLPVNKRQK